MTKIVLDIVLIILFVTIALLQVYVIRKIKKLKTYYKQFIKSEQSFMSSIEKARQSLMLVNSQATDILPELKLSMDKAEGLIQDFSFVMARANRKLDQLQESTTDQNIMEANQNSILKTNNKETTENSDIVNDVKLQTQININRVQESQPEDALLSRLAKLEKEEEMSKLKVEGKHPIPKLSTQEELIEKALREIL